MPASVNDAPAGDAQQTLLAALAQRYGGDPFSARDAAASIPSTLWQGVGIGRPDANACGRWLCSHRSTTLVGRPDWGCGTWWLPDAESAP